MAVVRRSRSMKLTCIRPG